MAGLRFICLVLFIWNFGAHAQDSSCIWLNQLQENCADFPEQLFYKKNGERIVNGTVVDIGEIQWQAHLATKEGKWKNGFCGGTLLCDRFVLTAAHCCVGYPKPEVVILGDHYAEKRNDPYEIRIDVKKIIIHPGYNNINYNNDIAILQLAKPVRNKKGIRNACLPKYEPRQQEVKEMLITGWGGKYFQGPTSNVLLKAEVDLVSRKKCKEMYNKPWNGQTEDITERMICAASPGKDTCQGDSGGPLVIRNNKGKAEVVGITSWGFGCANPNYPGVYTNVATFKHWIAKIIRQNI